MLIICVIIEIVLSRFDFKIIEVLEGKLVRIFFKIYLFIG